MSRYRTLGLAGAAAALLVPLAACGGGSASAKNSPSAGTGSTPATHLSVGAFPITGYLQDYVARDKGFFIKNNLDVNLISPLTGATAVQLMSNDKLQVYPLDFFTTLQAVSRKANVTVGACLAPVSVYVMVVRPGLNLPPASAPFIDRVKALQGKTVGVTGLNAGTDRALTAMLSAAGLSTSSVHHIGVGVPTAAAGQLKAGRIDAYVTGSYSGAYQIEAAVPGTSLYLDTGDPQAPTNVQSFATSVWAMSGAWVKANPGVVKRYITALQQALVWIQKNPGPAAQVMSDDMFGGTDLAVAQKSVNIEIKNFYNPALTGLKCDRKAFTAAANVFQAQGLGQSSAFTYGQIVSPIAREN